MIDLTVAVSDSGIAIGVIGRTSRPSCSIRVRSLGDLGGITLRIEQRDQVARGFLGVEPLSQRRPLRALLLGPRLFDDPPVLGDRARFVAGLFERPPVANPGREIVAVEVDGRLVVVHRLLEIRLRRVAPRGSRSDLVRHQVRLVAEPDFLFRGFVFSSERRGGQLVFVRGVRHRVEAGQSQMNVGVFRVGREIALEVGDQPRHRHVLDIRAHVDAVERGASSDVEDGRSGG